MLAVGAIWRYAVMNYIIRRRCVQTGDAACRNPFFCIALLFFFYCLHGFFFLPFSFLPFSFRFLLFHHVFLSTVLFMLNELASRQRLRGEAEIQICAFPMRVAAGCIPLWELLCSLSRACERCSFSQPTAYESHFTGTETKSSSFFPFALGATRYSNLWGCSARGLYYFPSSSLWSVNLCFFRLFFWRARYPFVLGKL